MHYVLAALFGAFVAVWGSRLGRSFRLRRRFRRGRSGEAEAQKLLRARGYEILDEQAARTGLMWVDGQAVEYDVRADFLATKRWRTFVVEAKTGKIAPDPTSSATRRQLLEYSLIYDVDGLILADMNAKKLVEIRFPEAAARAGGARLATAVFMLGAIAGAGGLHVVQTMAG